MDDRIPGTRKNKESWGCLQRRRRVGWGGGAETPATLDAADSV